MSSIGVSRAFTIIGAAFSLLFIIILYIEKNPDYTVGVKWIFRDNVFWIYLKKHYCPKCNARLKISYDSRIVNSNSLEGKQYDFSLLDTDMHGDVKFKMMRFHCPKCDSKLSFYDVRNMETKRDK
jgi:hypothetical protein